MLLAEFQIEINDEFYSIDDLLKLFECYQNPDGVFEFVFAFKQGENTRYWLHYENDVVKEIDVDKNRKWHQKIFQLNKEWPKVTNLNSYCKNDLLNFLSSKANRELLMPEKEWANLLEKGRKDE